MAYEFFRTFALASYDDAIRNALFLNKQTLGDTFYCRVPSEIFHDVELLSVCEVGHNNISQESITTSADNPWIDIASTAMNLEAGAHMYQFKFRNKRFGEEMSLYLYYNLQDDDPEKPYIYMNRGA